MRKRDHPSFSFSLVLLVVVLLFGEVWFSSSSSYALSCVSTVSPTESCFDVACTWNRALTRCLQNGTEASVWVFVLDPGVYPAGSSSESPLSLEIPLGLVDILPPPPPSHVLWIRFVDVAVSTSTTAKQEEKQKKKKKKKKKKRKKGAAGDREIPLFYLVIFSWVDDVVLRAGVDQVRIESGSSGASAVWSGAGAAMDISSSNDGVLVQVVGISFTNNAFLSVRLNSKNSSIVVDDCAFSDSIGKRALSIESGGLVTVKNSHFVGNLVGGGGEIQGNSLAVVIQDCQFVNNSMENGSGGGLLVNGSNGNVFVINSTFINNTAYGTGVGFSRCISYHLTFAFPPFQGVGIGCGGGGIAVYTAGTVDMLNSSFVRNTARNLTASSGYSGGGGMWLISGSVSLVRLSFNHNIAIENGGVANDANLDSNDWVHSGSSGGGGGWILASKQSVRMSEIQCHNNSAIENDLYGGRTYVPGSGGGCFWVRALNGSVLVQGGHFIGNQAIQNGAGMHFLQRSENGRRWNNGGGALWIWTLEAGKIEINQVLFAWNRANENGRAGNDNDNGNENGGDWNGGGAVWMESSLLALVSNCTIVHNSAIDNGHGGSRNKRRQRVWVLENGNGDGGSYNGGGAFHIYSSSARILITNCVVLYNNAFGNGHGGSDNALHGNGGSSNGGGAFLLYANSMPVVVSNSTILYNSANWNGRGGSENIEGGNGGSSNGGGALWMYSGTTSSEILMCTIKYNSAIGNGQGGDYANRNNTGGSNSGDGNGGSENGGGAVWTYAFTQNILQNTLFESNLAERNGNGGFRNRNQAIGGSSNGGGAVFSWSASPSEHFLSSQNHFRSNSALENGMGGTGSKKSTMTMGGFLCGGGAALLIGTSLTNSYFFNNSDENSGIVASSLVVGSDGSNNGGGAALAQESFFSNCTFAKNSVKGRRLSSSGNGGAIRLISGSKVEYSTFLDNTASFRGGAIASGSGENSIWYSSFSRNSATFDGGAVVVDISDVHLRIQNSQFTLNRASSSRGGALAVVGYLSSISTQNCSFSSNFAKSQGGAVAVFIEGGGYTSLHDEFIENHAETFGGVLYSGSEGSEDSGDRAADVPPAHVSLTHALFLNNSAGFGGVIMTDNRGSAFIDASRVLQNRASAISGGFAHVAVRSKLQVTGTLLQDNSAPVSAGTIFQEHFSSLFLESTLLTNSTAPYAGAIESIHNSRVSVSSNSTFSYNRATELQSGVLHVAGSVIVSVKDSRFYKNSALISGGVMSLLASSMVELWNVSLSNNYALSSGGGAFTLSSFSSLTMLDSICSNNVAKGGAGGCGLVADSALFSSDLSAFVSNRAMQGDGGALSFSSSKNFAINSSLFQENQAWRGGALSFNASSLWLSVDFYASLSSSICNSSFFGNQVYSPLSMRNVQNNEIGILAPGGGGSTFFNLPEHFSLSLAYRVWSSWSRINNFRDNRAIYGNDVASVGVAPYVSTLSRTLQSPCPNMSSSLWSITMYNTSQSLPSMPGNLVGLRVGVCDAFGHAIPTLQGDTIAYRWDNISHATSNIVQTTSNGTGEVQFSLPIVAKRQVWYTLVTQLSRQGTVSLPSMSLSWESSTCAPFYGFSPGEGCTVCSPSEYSISQSFQPCIPCTDLQDGATCTSIEYEKLRYTDPYGLISSPFLSNTEQITVVVVGGGYWPALSFTSSSSRAVVTPVPCPYEYCSRSGDSPLYVTGVSSTQSVVSTIDASLICNPTSNRQPSSPLCGACKEGFSEWNSSCQDCRDGISALAVFLFLLERFVWSLLQLILAQGREREESASILVFFTQSLFMFTFPQDVLSSQLQSMALFGSFFRQATQCVFNVSVPVSLALSTITPLLSLVFLWLIYVVHRSFAFCVTSLKRKQKTHVHVDRRCHCFGPFIKWIVLVATPTPYLRATALIILNMFGPMVFSVYLVWNCIPVPMGSTVIDVVFFAPAFQCHTEEYQKWQSFYIIVLVLLIFLVVWIFYTTYLFRSRHPSDSDLALERTSELSKDRSSSSIYLSPENGSSPLLQESVRSESLDTWATPAEESHRTASLQDELARIWVNPFYENRFWWIIVDFLIRLTFVSLFTFLLRILGPGAPIRITLSVAALLYV